MGHPAGVTELLGIGKNPTHLVTRSVGTEVFCVKVKERHKRRNAGFSNSYQHLSHLIFAEHKRGAQGFTKAVRTVNLYRKDKDEISTDTALEENYVTMTQGKKGLVLDKTDS